MNIRKILTWTKWAPPPFTKKSSERNYFFLKNAVYRSIPCLTWHEAMYVENVVTPHYVLSNVHRECQPTIPPVNFHPPGYVNLRFIGSPQNGAGYFFTSYRYRRNLNVLRMTLIEAAEITVNSRPVSLLLTKGCSRSHLG